MENTPRLQPPDQDQENPNSVVEVPISSIPFSTRSLVERNIIVMAPPLRNVEQKEAWWKNFHQGQGSVIKKGTKSGRSSFIFVTPYGEQFTYTKAQDYVREQKQLRPARRKAVEQGGILKSSPWVGRCGRKSNKSKIQHASRCKPNPANERKEFRDWFWKEKGGIVIRRQYPGRSTSKSTYFRWDTKYILPCEGKVFRSWKECVKYMGCDPDPAMTSWVKKGENGNNAIESGLVTVSCVTKHVPDGRRRRSVNVVPPNNSTVTTFHFGSLAEAQQDVTTSINSDSLGSQGLLQKHVLRSEGATTQELGGSCNRSNSGETPASAQADPKPGVLESDNGQASDFQSSEPLNEHDKYPSMRISSMTATDLNNEPREETRLHDNELELYMYGNEESVEPQRLLSEHAQNTGKNNYAVSSSPANGRYEENPNEAALMEGGDNTEKKRRRVMVVSTTSDESQTEDVDHAIDADGEKRKNGVNSDHNDSHPQVNTVTVNANVNDSSAAQPDIGLRMPLSSVHVLEAFSGKAAYRKPVPRKPRAKATTGSGSRNSKQILSNRSAGNNSKGAATSHEVDDYDHGGPSSKLGLHEGSNSNVDDETLHRNLINLLYADYIKQQPSRTTRVNGNVIGMLYAEYIERNFVRSNVASAQRPSATLSEKRIRIPKIRD